MTFYNNDDEAYVRKSEKTFDELSTLINLATSIQNTIVKKKNEIRKIIFTLITILYVILMILFITKLYMPTFINSDTRVHAFLLTLSFIIGISTFSLYRIIIIINELKIERATMQELMEIIFNLRKVTKTNSYNLVDMTILDLKLKRLRFY